MVLRVEDGVGPEGLCDVFVKVGGEGQVRVQVVHQAPVIGLQQRKGVNSMENRSTEGFK